MFAKDKNKKAEKQKESFSESVSSIAAVFVSGLFIITFILQAFEIPSGSMENTLLVGDHVFVDRVTPMAKGGLLGWMMPYRQIQRGDIVVFLHPKEHGMYVVKRVMGIPGDHIHLQNGVVYRNGEPLTEPYVLRQGTGSEYRENFPKGTNYGGEYPDWPIEMSSHLQNGELVVPLDSYFGMGDHRDVSLDSRYWGFIPRDHIVGRPLFIYWSFVTPTDQYQRRDMGNRLSFLVHTIVHFFDQTRWSRMFRLVH